MEHTLVRQWANFSLANLSQFISTFDLTEGYWKVALACDTRPKMAFSTISVKWQYRVLQFGLHRVPVTFKIYNVLKHTSTQSDHLHHIRKVLESLQKVELMANPWKFCVGLTEG